MEYIMMAIPFFIILIVIEWAFSFYKKETSLYSLKDTICNLSCGILQLIVDLVTKSAMGIFYLYIYLYVAPIHLQPSFLTWITVIVAVDFCYYWFHRESHRVAFFWAFHVVHHQSEKYNLSVALRQSSLNGLVSWIFYLPLAYLGFSPMMTLTAYSINLLYQFWIHTSLISHLGILENILNTPSHHRVHHGRNEEYLDKNYAGILIIWDKLFGSFTPEKNKPIYGLVHPLKSNNPVWANLHFWFELFSMSQKKKTFMEKVKIFFKPPANLTDST